MSDIEELTNRIVEFNKKREWNQFHNPKDIALSLVLEAAEVMELFQWKNPKEIEDYLKNSKDDVGEELADVLYWVLLISNDLKIDIKSAFEKKMKKNEAKYPIEKAKGIHTKYNKL
jgi:dCTP diphosphatase